MADPVTLPGTVENEPFTYEYKDGRLFVEGIEVERNLEDRTHEVPIDEPEGEAGKPAVVAKPPEEPPKAEEPPKVEPPVPEPPKVPEKQKYRIKVQGEERELELTPEQLIARLQMAEDYQLKTTQLAEQRRKVEPFIPIIEKPAFKEWLNEQVQAGLIEAPAPPPPPAPEDVVGYRLRMQDPEFAETRQAMVEWAATLPQYESDILASNHRAFNETYDRFKAARGPKLSPAPQAAPPQVADKAAVDKIIAAKEVAKEKAKVEPPGGTPPEVDEKKEWKRVNRELAKAVRSGVRQVIYDGRRMDADVAYALHQYGDTI